MYTTPEAGKALTSVVIQGVKTPALKVKFCNNKNPFYYQNSPQVPRYSITCVVDPELHKDFIKTISTIEQREKTEHTTLKPDISKNEGVFTNTGLWLLKFNEKKPIRSVIKDGENILPYEDSQDIPVGSEVQVEFDIIRYTKRGSSEVGLSLRPSCITFIKSTAPVTPNFNSNNSDPFEHEALF